jgi:hypothetical protein
LRPWRDRTDLRLADVVPGVLVVVIIAIAAAAWAIGGAAAGAQGGGGLFSVSINTICDYVLLTCRYPNEVSLVHPRPGIRKRDDFRFCFLGFARARKVPSQLNSLGRRRRKKGSRIRHAVVLKLRRRRRRRRVRTGVGARRRIVDALRVWSWASGADRLARRG